MRPEIINRPPTLEELDEKTADAMQFLMECAYRRRGLSGEFSIKRRSDGKIIRRVKVTCEE